LNGEVEELFASDAEELFAPSTEEEELFASDAEEVESVLADEGEVAGGATCWAKEEPHKASRATTLKEKWVNRVVGRIFIVMVQSTIRLGL
jgi:hypothetical protein